MSQAFKGKCGICGSNGLYARPSLRLCNSCYRLYDMACTPIVEMSGWPANQTYYRSKNEAAIKKWFAHLRKNGFVQKRGRWERRKNHVKEPKQT